MPYLLLGLVLLIGALLLMRAFVNADPAKLGRFLGWFLATLGAAGAVLGLVFLIATDRFAPALAAAGAVAPLVYRTRRIWQPWLRRGAAGPQVSEVETDWLRMRLDHETGTMSGTVRRGPFQGRHLHELSREELLGLWRECRAEDTAAASLLEAYLDRLMPGWREAEAPDAAGAGQRAAAADAMTIEEAYAILGLAPGADADAIKAAHRRLMKKLHPDLGGSTWLAAKINRAKEMLLKAAG